MKTIAIVLVLVAAASAQLGGNAGGLGGGLGGLGGAGGRAGGGAGGLRGGFQQPRNWGPRVYGPGANNRFAFPPNPFLMQRALSIVQNVPGALIFLDTNGEISFTDKFGREAEIITPFGQDLSELIEF